ncbi:MAG: DUF1624 domain-containing protein [Cytophagales bacterium]|nr:DUF1624 domain-containing protein [Cytophagales bacterium]
MKPQVSSRVYHIDALRGVAILMMLQGHFIYTLMQNEVRVGSVYEIWKFCRGLTAPVFFTTSGVILVYLLLRKSDVHYRKLRVKKACWRGLEVIMWGYILRFNLWPFLFHGRVYKEFWKVDVLQCIGVGLLLIALIYFLVSKLPDNVFRIVIPLLAISVFIFHPIYFAYDYSDWPPAIRNYFTREYGSVFKLFPFLGYVLVGAFLGSLYTALYEKRKSLFIGGLFVIGLLLVNFSSWTLQQLYYLMDVELFAQVANNNFGFWRLGQIFLIYSVFMLAEPIMPRLKILNRLGQHTLTVYIIHFFILYGSVFGLGIDDILIEKKTLGPYAVAGGALIFIVVVSWLTLKYHSWKDSGYVIKRYAIKKSS